MPIFTNGRVHRVCTLRSGQIEWRIESNKGMEDLVVTLSPVEAIQVGTALLGNGVGQAHPFIGRAGEAEERNG